MKNKVLVNASWIVICKVAQSIIALIIGMITARFLGPTNYGLVTYASSLVAFVLPVMQLGFNSTLVQEILDNPENEGRIIGTSVICSFVAAIVSIIGISSFVLIANPGEKETIIVCFLYSLSLLFSAIELIQYWFQAKYLSKFPSIASVIAYTVSAGYKCYLLITGKGIRWFAVTHVIETLIISVLLLIILKKRCDFRLKFSFDIAKRMLSNSKHYIISGIMVSIFQQTDRVMLKIIHSETDTGYYSSAITCIGITAFVFSAIIESARPLIFEKKKESKVEFEEKVKQLFSIITLLSLAQSIVMTVLAKPIILLLFGSDYLPSVPILQIAVWFSTFGYYGVVRNIWILAEQKQYVLWIINLVGALTNVILNMLLIPSMGGMGAAVASLLTQIVSNFVLSFLLKDIRSCGRIMIKSLNPKGWIPLLNKIIKSIGK